MTFRSRQRANAHARHLIGDYDAEKAFWEKQERSERRRDTSAQFLAMTLVAATVIALLAGWLP